MRVLILGGTTEAAQLAARIAGDGRFVACLSLAGVTQNPAPSPIERRMGGFGGAEGLAAYLRERRVDALIDATHPFAARISANAAQAAHATGIPLLRLCRPPWTVTHEYSDLDAAATALGSARRRVFLTIGRKDLAAFARRPWHHYVIRSVDAPPEPALPPLATVITARGPFTLDGERALLREHRIDALVCKNSGGTATAAKLDAAREMGITMLVVGRPTLSPAETVTSPDMALAWLAARNGIAD